MATKTLQLPYENAVPSFFTAENSAIATLQSNYTSRETNTKPPNVFSDIEYWVTTERQRQAMSESGRTHCAISQLTQ
jgi:hypothetical protein